MLCAREGIGGLRTVHKGTAVVTKVETGGAFHLLHNEYDKNLFW